MKWLFLILLFPLISVGSSKKPIKVMVIDTGIDTSHELFKKYSISGESRDLEDLNGHGTHVAGIILYGNRMSIHHGQVLGKDPVCPQVELISCKNFGKGLNSITSEVGCLDKATKLKVDFVNFSEVGSSYSKIEFEAYKDYLNSGGIALVAAGNDSLDLTKHKIYPASYSFDKKLKNLFVVESADYKGRVSWFSNYHLKALKAFGVNVLSSIPGNMYEYKTGTSQATPEILHIILKQRCKLK